MSRSVRFGDVVHKVNRKVDPVQAGLQRFVAGEHMDSGEPRVTRFGVVGDGYLGPAFQMHFHPGHILYGSRRTYLRKVAMADFEGVCANTTFVLEPSTPDLDAMYLLYVMSTERFHENSIGLSKGSVNPYINFSDIAAYEFELPSLDEQAHIVELLSAIDDHIDSLQRQDEVLRSLRYTTIDDFMTNPRPSWPHLTINQCISINPTGIKLDADSPFVPMENVIAGVRFVLEFESRGSRSGCRARGGDVLFARITPCLENGKTAQVPYEIEVCGGSTEFIVLSPSHLVTADFIYVWATWPRLRSIAASMMTGTTGRQRLSPQALGGIEIDLPSVQEQKELVAKIEAIDSLIVHNQLSSVSAKNLRMSLLNSKVK